MSWFKLVVAGLLEVGWAIGLKYTHGFTRFTPSVLTISAIVVSMWLLASSARTIPIGTAYAVWVGIGATGAAILGVVLFREPLTPSRAFFLVLLVVALLGLKLTGGSGPSDLPSSS
jgi:quaternary ammonium compound-resistance protein SugE